MLVVTGVGRATLVFVGDAVAVNIALTVGPHLTRCILGARGDGTPDTRGVLAVVRNAFARVREPVAIPVRYAAGFGQTNAMMDAQRKGRAARDADTLFFGAPRTSIHCRGGVFTAAKVDAASDGKQPSECE